MKLFFLFILNAYAFMLNVPINTHKHIYNSQIIKVYEPKLLEKKDLNAIIFYTGANSLIPADIYSNFIRCLNNYNFSVSVVTNDNIATKEFLNNIKDSYKEIIPLSHSSGYVNIINTINKEKNIKKGVFLDPVDNSFLVNNNFPFLNNNQNNEYNQYNLNYVENILLLRAEKSYKGSIFPKLEIPFIPAFALNGEKLEKLNPDLTINKISAENYGHSDVLDSLWSDLMHASLSKGNENRDQSNLDSYVDWLAQQIYEFVNKENIENIENIEKIEKIENSVSSEEPTNTYSRSILNLYDEDRYS
tara:strand:- start:10 stop:918 length:909 start_codon:yes stop_codon:yes gene_type:complete